MKKDLFSRIGFILAGLGMAIGTGNIWRFPRMVATYGGGAFLIPWVIALFLWSIPLLIVETSLGKHFRKGVVGTLKEIFGEKYAFLGGFVAGVSLFITFYYAVVMGWCIYYFLFAVIKGFQNLTPQQAQKIWESFSNSNLPVLFQIIAIILGISIVIGGIKKGIEKANKILLPSLLILMVILVIYALSLKGSYEGLKYLFGVNLDYLGRAEVWVQAFSQSAWSTGAGWGLLLTYAVYLHEKEDTVSNSSIIAIGDSIASLLAGLIVIPTIFALLPIKEAFKAIQSGNVGLSFIWFPSLIGKIHFGRFFGILFFLALIFAALSSFISLLELGVRILIDWGMERKQAAILTGISVFFFGLPSAFNLNVLNNQDWVWGLGLLISGIIFVSAVYKIGGKKLREEIINPYTSIKLGKFFDFLIKYLIPMQFLILIGWWIYNGIKWTGKYWWHPFKVYSVGTCIYQWLFLIFLLFLINKLLVRKK